MTMTASNPASSDYMLQLMWPGYGVGDVEMRALPDATNPRMLIPAEGRTGRAVLSALRDASSSRARLRTHLLKAAWSTPFRPGTSIRVPTGGVTEQLASQLSHEIVVGVHLGPARANRKPVLALATADGDLIGFAKLGVNPLTDRLVKNEASALQQLTMLSVACVPGLILHDSWAGHPIVLQSALPRHGRAIGDTDGVVAAQIEVARALGTARGGSAFLDGIDNRLGQAADPTDATGTDAVRRVRWLMDSAKLVERLGDVECGSWHGDWRATNMAVRRSGVMVWDWERFAVGVPVGFDALHLCLTGLSPRLSDLSDLVPLVFSRAPQVLLPFGITEREGVDVVTLLYFIELATRYIEDQQSRTGTRLGDVGAWLLPALEQRYLAVP